MFGSLFADIIIGLIALIGLLATAYRVYYRRYTHLVQMAPGAAVSLGIFGTFVGVYIGLQGFDVGDISASIPRLLDGLKTAFMTSIWGIAVSIGLRVLYGRMDDADAAGQRQSEDPTVLLQHIAVGIDALNATSRQLADAMNAQVRGPSAEAVAAQFQMVQGEIRTTRAAMVGAFEGFSNQMAETGIDALVKALEQVIRDFNALLGELVGSAFRDLSAAMLRLVQWQENHQRDMAAMRDRVEALLAQSEASTDVLNRSASALAQAETQLERAAGSLAALSVHAADLEAHTEALKAQNAQLQAGLMHIRALGESARQVVPSLDRQMKDMAQTLVEAASESASQLAQSNAAIAEFVASTTRDLKAAGEAQNQAVQQALEAMDKGLEVELTKALNSLAGSLAALSERFVRDYQPLTERLREVVRLAETGHDRQP